MSHILIIEPDILSYRNYQIMLEDVGYTTAWAESGQIAIHVMEDKLPDLILLELQLVGHNGVEFLHEVRSYPEWQNIPVIIISSVPDASVGDTKSLEQLGVVGYLYKPQTKLRHIQKAVSRALSVNTK